MRRLYWEGRRLRYRATAAHLRDHSTVALIGFSWAADTNPFTASTHRTDMEELFAILAGVSFQKETHLRGL